MLTTRIFALLVSLFVVFGCGASSSRPHSPGSHGSPAAWTLELTEPQASGESIAIAIRRTGDRYEWRSTSRAAWQLTTASVEPLLAELDKVAWSELSQARPVETVGGAQVR